MPKGFGQPTGNQRQGKTARELFEKILETISYRKEDRRVVSYKETKNLMELICPSSQGLWHGTPTPSSCQGNAETVQDCPIHWRVSAASGRIIFLKLDIFDPMQSILNLPMLTSGVQQLSGSPVRTAQVVHRFFKGFSSPNAAAMHNPIVLSDFHLAHRWGVGAKTCT